MIRRREIPSGHARHIDLPEPRCRARGRGSSHETGGGGGLRGRGGFPCEVRDGLQHVGGGAAGRVWLGSLGGWDHHPFVGVRGRRCSPRRRGLGAALPLAPLRSPPPPPPPPREERGPCFTRIGSPGCRAGGGRRPSEVGVRPCGDRGRGRGGGGRGDGRGGGGG